MYTTGVRLRIIEMSPALVMSSQPVTADLKRRQPSAFTFCADQIGERGFGLILIKHFSTTLVLNVSLHLTMVIWSKDIAG